MVRKRFSIVDGTVTGLCLATLVGIVICANAVSKRARALVAAIDSDTQLSGCRLENGTESAPTEPFRNIAIWWLGPSNDASRPSLAGKNGFLVGWAGGPLNTRLHFYDKDSDIGAPPSFQEVNAIVILKSELAQHKQFIALPKGVYPGITPYNPFGNSEPRFVDQTGRQVDRNELQRVWGTTLNIKAWVLARSQCKVIGYHEFEAKPIEDYYIYDVFPDIYPEQALDAWVRSFSQNR